VEDDAPEPESEDSPIPPGTSTGALRVFVKRPAGAPASGVVVKVDTLGRAAAQTFLAGVRHTDAQGLARWPRLPVGKWQVSVQLRRQFSLSSDAEVTAGGEARLEFEAPEYLKVRGRVVNAQGAGVAKATVIAVLAPEEEEPDDVDRAPVVTDASGRFEISELGDFAFDFSASHPREGAGRARAHAPADGVVITLSTGAIVFGSVLDLSGHAPSYVVRLFAEAGGRGHEKLEALFVEKGAPFEFKNPISPGRYEVHLDVEGGRTLEKKFEVSAGQRRVEVRFELPKGGAIGGRVVDERGAPIARVRVSLLPERAQDDRRDGVSQDDGRFLIEGLTAPSYRVTVISSEYLQQEPVPTAALGEPSVTVTVVRRARRVPHRE
jgi:hypothetical protein